jgi:hypothetical protein
MDSFESDETFSSDDSDFEEQNSVFKDQTVKK